MRPVPHSPDFPVYGLGDRFTGFRWLTLWQDRNRLWSITLGHGRPESGSWIAVETSHKTPMDVTLPGLAVGPTGLEVAALGAAMRLVDLTASDDAKALAMAEETERVQPLSDDGPVPFLGWAVAEVAIDGASVPARSRRTARGWASVVDLPTVAVAISGPVGTEDVDLDVRDVTARLVEYA